MQQGVAGIPLRDVLVEGGCIGNGVLRENFFDSLVKLMRLSLMGR